MPLAAITNAGEDPSALAPGCFLGSFAATTFGVLGKVRPSYLAFAFDEATHGLSHKGTEQFL